MTDGGDLKGKKKNKKKKKKAKENDGQDETVEQPTDDADPEPTEEVDLETSHEVKDDGQLEQSADSTKVDETEEGDDTIIADPPQKSPLLTSHHRFSTVSSLDEVNLMNSKEDDSLRDSVSAKLDPPSLPSKDERAPSPSSALKTLSGSLPSLPWGAAPANKTSPPPAPSSTTRKASGPFAWFSRSSTGKDVKSPPQSAYNRRNTANSVSTIGSHLDSVARSQDGEDGDASSVNSRRPRRNSLKDQFKLLRMKEEHNAENDQTSVRSGHGSMSQSAASPPIIPEEGEDGMPAVPAAPASGATSPGAASTTPSTINPTLDPGTVSGFSRSATDSSAPVDWDLWQQLVNDGPQALANSENLNAAIKRGIPQTIRGVIWQILANCRTGELEDIYRELVARGPDKTPRGPNGSVNGIGEKESIASSRSSIRSEHSGSGSHSTSVAPSPSQEADPERLAKEQASSESARLKKAKDEAAALQKLEKTIRRDLGARTSYSKYFVSQGSQESLFNLCKAYALYDEAVGYAQGMNFIIMPLLFNVSSRPQNAAIDVY